MVQTEKSKMAGSPAAGLAHEINNPLAVIMQLAQNIERRISPDIPANLEAARELGISLDDVRAYLEKRDIPAFIAHIREAGARISRLIAGNNKGSIADGLPAGEEAALPSVCRSREGSHEESA